MQTPQEQAQQVIDRITSSRARATGGPLLAVLPFDPTPAAAHSRVGDARRAARRPATRTYTGDAGFRIGCLTYVGNPYQVTAPLHGTVYGFVDFASLVPPANYDGFRIDTPINLKGVQEIFFTVEGDTVDPLNRGPLFLTSKLTPGGRDVVHFDLVHRRSDGAACRARRRCTSISTKTRSSSEPVLGAGFRRSV